MAFFEVVCRCGHVGNGKYVLKSFPVFARDAKETARKARNIPRVKHHNKHAIEEVIRIDEFRYEEIREQNHMDPYFQCRNKREQNAVCDLQVIVDWSLVNPDPYRTDDAISRRPVYSGKTKVKNPRKFYKYHCDDDLVA